MARRKKEERIVHQTRIAEIAAKLFSECGIDNTTMDQIATEAGYSKATLYVYFKNKENIVGFLSYISLKKLKEHIQNAINRQDDLERIFMDICFSLADYQNQYPDFFEKSINSIQYLTDKDTDNYYYLSNLEGEEINKIIFELLERGCKRGVLKESQDLLELTFQIWGMISGVIMVFVNKEEYLTKKGGYSKKQFLESGFNRIYSTIRKEV